jgi:cytochrome P450
LILKRCVEVTSYLYLQTDRDMPVATFRMELTLVFPVLIALIAIYLAYFTLFDPLAGIPGPFWARFSRLWMVYHARKGDTHTTMIALHVKHGHLVRTAHNEVSISDPSALKAIYGVGTKFRKSDWYSVFQGHRKFDLFGVRDERVHAQQRRQVNMIYSMDNLKKSEPAVDSTVTLFLDRVSEAARKGPIDMGKWAQLFAFDVIGEVTFSRAFGFLAAGKDDGSFAAIDEALVSAAWIGQVPWLYWLHDFMMPVIGNWLGVNKRHGSLRGIAFKECEARKERKIDRKDLLASLYEAHEKRPDEFDDSAVLSMATTNIFAGSDTTGISIGAVMYNLCKYPQCKIKLIQEIKDTVQREGVKEGVNMPLNAGMAMPYLQACIYEGLRLHPAVGMTLPKVVPPEGYEIEGMFLPGGVNIQRPSCVTIG